MQTDIRVSTVNPFVASVSITSSSSTRRIFGARSPGTSPTITVHGPNLSLAKDAPTPRRVQAVTERAVIAFREVGGLRYRYERRVA
jgi:hypothetical protein